MQKFNNVSILPNSVGDKEEFFRIYSSLPLEEREKVIVIIDDEPISWNLAYQEIKHNTNRARNILKVLKELEII